jgi:phosphoesterase RecJ-like protein
VVDAEANSTTEILFHLFRKIGIEITEDLAISLLTGLVTDTLGFRTSRVSASTLKMASFLVEAGADLFNVTSKALNRKPMSTLLIWQKGLSNMKLEDGLIWTTITNAERLETGHNGSSSFGLGNMMANAYPAAMSAVLLEMENGHISVGFRSKPPYSVAELAESLGGGGHPLAAGCTLDGPLSEAERLVVSRSKETIRKHQAPQ